MPTQFRDASGQERLLGTIYVPGASVGDVFTVQADGSLAPAPGGGASQPLAKTITAAEFAAAWDADDSIAAIEWTGFPLEVACLFLAVKSNTLDHNCTVSNLAAFTPSATSTQVWNGGDFNVGVAIVSNATYETLATYDPTMSPAVWFKSNAAAYVVIAGDSAPTSGAVTVYAATA